MKNSLADIELGPLRGFGPLGNPEERTAVSTFSNFISSTIGLLTIIAIIWFVFILITGGIGIMSAGGDKQSLENAQKRITTGLIGLVVVVVGIFIVRLIGGLIGIPDILNVSNLFDLIAPK
jgi:hypothetical protein